MDYDDADYESLRSIWKNTQDGSEESRALRRKLLEMAGKNPSLSEKLHRVVASMRVQPAVRELSYLERNPIQKAEKSELVKLYRKLGKAFNENNESELRNIFRELKYAEREH